MLAPRALPRRGCACSCATNFQGRITGNFHHAAVDDVLSGACDHILKQACRLNGIDTDGKWLANSHIVPGGLASAAYDWLADATGVPAGGMDLGNMPELAPADAASADCGWLAEAPVLPDPSMDVSGMLQPAPADPASADCGWLGEAPVLSDPSTVPMRLASGMLPLGSSTGNSQPPPAGPVPAGYGMVPTPGMPAAGMDSSGTLPLANKPGFEAAVRTLRPDQLQVRPMQDGARLLHISWHKDAVGQPNMLFGS